MTIYLNEGQKMVFRLFNSTCSAVFKYSALIGSTNICNVSHVPFFRLSLFYRKCGRKKKKETYLARDLSRSRACFTSKNGWTVIWCARCFGWKRFKRTCKYNMYAYKQTVVTRAHAHTRSYYVWVCMYVLVLLDSKQ